MGLRGRAGLVCWAIADKLICLTLNRRVVYRNWKACVLTENRFPDGQQQQAISMYFFLEGSGSRV